jgi:hypothetical protein
MTQTLATREAVLAAADELSRQGAEPTYEAVRERVGGGSFATIQKWLAQWRAAKAVATQHPPPAAVAAKASAFVDGLWASARQEAERAFEGERESAARMRDAVQAQLNEAQREVNAAQARCIQELDAQVQRLTQAHEQARIDAERQAARAAALDAQCQALGHELAELRRMQLSALQASTPDAAPRGTALNGSQGRAS